MCIKYSVNDSANRTVDLDSCPEWWCDDLSTLVMMEVFVITLCILGNFGNLITLLAIIFSSLRYRVNCILIGSLSFAGFLYCSLILPMQAVVFHKQSHRIPENFCLVAGGIRYSLVGCIMLHLGVIALYRFLNVVQMNDYKFMSETRQLTISIALCWIVPLFFTIPPTFKVWGAFTFQSEILACTFDEKSEPSNRITTITCGFIIPCLFIIYCYVRIGYFALQSFKRIGKSRSTNPQKRAFRLSAMMMCIFFMFFLGTFPYFVLNIIDKEFQYPIHHIWTTMLGWLLYCLNPVVYTIMDNNFRTAYRRFLMGDCEKPPVRRNTNSMVVRATAV